MSRWRRYFNPRPPRGGRRLPGAVCHPFSIFQSTPPARGATPSIYRRIRHGKISIHAPREGGRPLELLQVAHGVSISIHAPREGGDLFVPFPSPYLLISIHAPREGGDMCGKPLEWDGAISIHAPREGGDMEKLEVGAEDIYFNPRPPRGGRLFHNSTALV